MSEQPYELTQGDIVYDGPISPDTPYTFHTLAPGSDLGNPVPVVEEVRSMLTDGSLAVVSSHANRTITFRLMIEAFDGLALAEAEAVLMAEKMADRPSRLIYTPMASDAWPAAFDVVHMNIERDYEDDLWDLDERMHARRFYRVTWECLPWASDVDPTVIPALPVPTNPGVPATYTTIDTASTSTGWAVTRCHAEHYTSASMSTGSTSGNTYIRGTGTLEYTSGLGWMGLRVAGSSFSMSGDPYLTVDAATNVVADGGVRISYQASTPTWVTVTAIASEALSADWTRHYFEVPDTFTALRVEGWWSGVASPSVRTLDVYEIGRTDRVEINGSNGFQIARTATVGGSAPTQAALTFDATPDPLLGSTALIYTGQSPAIPLRNHRTSSATVTVDATKISGAYNDLSSAMVVRVPVSQFSQSTYSLLARLSSTDTITVNWSAKVVASDGSAIPGSELVVSGSALLTNTTADAWKIHDLAAIQMPVVAIEGTTTHKVEVSISMTSGGASVLIDEGWLLDTDQGAVTVVHEPSAFQLTTVEVRSPELDSPRPAVVGTWVTHGTQDISRLASPGTHLFEPGLLHVFTATDLAKYASCTLTYYRRHHTHPGPDRAVEAA